MEYIYDDPTAPPQDSPHWKSLTHQPGDLCLNNIDELKRQILKEGNDASRLPLWSSLLGYCEALCTSSKPDSRYSPFPIPINALERLVATEFTPPSGETNHRHAARDISNWVWSKVVPKSNVKDEKHANSLYTVLRGNIDNKSVDCFGAAVVTVIALRQQGFESSTLTLSEDHAYESHDDATCEVAIPGNTKAQKQKRGQEIAETFNKNSKNDLTPSTSWLYMGGNAVQCNTPGMILAAILANMNCLIESKAKIEVYSLPLFIMKRELLWLLKDDRQQLDCFPFAICELGWSEEHVTSERGEERVSIEWEGSSVDVTRMEQLYHDAIVSNKTHYQDMQVYPYTYLGYFHKDGGQEEEFRLSLALQFFSEAARVASGYKYEPGDTLQLTKVFTKISEFIVTEILGWDNQPRSWQNPANALSCARWLIAFFDYLLRWEENSGSERFLPICSSNHKTGLAKAFAQLTSKIRIEAFASAPEFQSQRFQGSLRAALEANKVSVSDIHLTIVQTDMKRRRKRKVQD